MFCTFHRLRLMPVVNLAYYSEVRPEHLTALIVKHRLTRLDSARTLYARRCGWPKWRKCSNTQPLTSIVLQQEEWGLAAHGGRRGSPLADEVARLKKLDAVNVREICARACCRIP